MIKTPLKQTSKSPKTLIVFSVLMMMSFFMVTCAVFPKFDNFSFKLAVVISFFMAAVFGTLAWQLDPGYLRKDKSNFEFMTLLELFEPNCLCPECEVIRTSRSRHCNVCKKCVDRFDHHCPWINNCVGVR